MKSVIINPDDHLENFWGKNYSITVGRFGGPFIVNADCEQDALDYLADWCEVNAPGLLWTIEEELALEFPDEYITAGNHGRKFSEIEIHIEDYITNQGKNLSP